MSNAYLCAGCLARVQWIGKAACRGCGFPLGPHGRSRDNCGRCRGLNLPLASAFAVARYREGARDLVISLKFRWETELAAPMAELMVARLRAAGVPDLDAVLPVPLHPSRIRERGYNQSAFLADAVAKRLGLPTDHKALFRVRRTAPQALLGRADRQENIKDAFRANADLSGRRVLIVDDVMTTGATMGECARTCRQAGATRVHALAFAR
jgi:ComF family protein